MPKQTQLSLQRGRCEPVAREYNGMDGWFVLAFLAMTAQRLGEGTAAMPRPYCICSSVDSKIAPRWRQVGRMEKLAGDGWTES